jgi:hypothetical protein
VKFDCSIHEPLGSIVRWEWCGAELTALTLQKRRIMADRGSSTTPLLSPTEVWVPMHSGGEGRAD